MRAAATTGTVSAAHGSTTAYHDASPRIPVTAITLMETCWRCSWVASHVTGGWQWSLKAVSAACPEHRELRKSWKAPAAPG
jgi:hypothetical protein